MLEDVYKRQVMDNEIQEFKCQDKYSKIKMMRITKNGSCIEEIRHKYIWVKELLKSQNHCWQQQGSD